MTIDEKVNLTWISGCTSQDPTDGGVARLGIPGSAHVQSTSWKSKYIYIYIYIYMCVYIDMCICTCVYMIHAYIYIYMVVCVYIYIYIYMYMYVIRPPLAASPSAWIQHV